MKFTKKAIECLQFPETKARFFWDDNLKGFGLRVTPTTKTFIAQARVNGKVRRVTIGRFGVYTLHQAREQAVEELRAMSQGIDPTAEKKRQEALSVTLYEVSEAYIEDRNLKGRSVADIRRHVKNNFTGWKDKPVAEITRQKCLNKFREISAKSHAQANQAFRVLRSLLNYARATYRPDDRPILLENPVGVISDAKLWHNVQAKSRRIPNDKVGAAYNFLHKEREWPGNTEDGRTVVDAVLFMLMTGCRRGEALSLKWEDVNLEDQSWRIIDPKNRHPVVLPMSDQVKQLLENRPRVNEYVFHSTKARTGHVSDPKRLMRKVSDAVGAQVSAHDLRRTFRAVAGECGVELWKVKLLLNHKLTGDVTLESYTETSDCRYLLADAQAISDYIERQAIHAASGNVVELKSAKGA